MKTESTVPVRRGVARTLTFDKDAAALLDQLVPHRKSHGRVLSELIRGEIRRREERAHLAQMIREAK